MVRELFATPGAGQDAAIFSFASDVEADQRMEIGRMGGMLEAILAGSRWAGLLPREVWSLTVGFALPAVAGAAAGVLLFERMDQRRFRQIVFVLILLSGLGLLVRG